jgi:hypothetical protein
MGSDRRREELLRLLDEIERVPERPVGPHLDEEDFIGLARGALCSDRETEVFEHIRSCAACSEDALNVPDVLDAAAESRRGAAAAARATVDQRAVALAWMVTTAVWVARRRRRGIVRLSGSPADSEEHPSTKFEWAIIGSGIGIERTLSVRTQDRGWFEKPVSCAVKDTRNWVVAEAWVMLFAEDDQGRVYGTSPFHAGAPTTRFKSVEVKAYESYDRLESIEPLRRAFLQAAGAEREAWEKWLKSEVETGRLTRDQASAISGP